MSPLDATGFHLRPSRLPSDIPALFHLMQVIKEADKLDGEISESALQAEIEWHGNDPEQDRWIIESLKGHY